jgi:hypothetical protein
MSNNSPWSVKGIGAETRQAVKAAAKERGVTVGQWLTEAILAAASAQLAPTVDRQVHKLGNKSAPAALPDDMAAAVAELTQEVRALRAGSTGGVASSLTDGSPTQAPLEHRISRLEAQISELADAIEAAMLPPRHLEPWEKESHLGYSVSGDDGQNAEDAAGEPRAGLDDEAIGVDEAAAHLSVTEKERRLRGLLARFLDT